MKTSEFRRAVAAEFGGRYGAVVTRDTHLAELEGRTAEEALAGGVPAARVWIALCIAEDVPESRRHGRGLPEPQS